MRDYADKNFLRDQPQKESNTWAWFLIICAVAYFMQGILEWNGYLVLRY